MNTIFTKIYNWIGNYKITVLLLLLVLTAASVYRLSRVSFKSNIDLMLPVGSKIARDIDFLQNSPFSNKVVISLSGGSVKELIAASDELAKVFCHTDEHGLTRTNTDVEDYDSNTLDKSNVNLSPQQNTSVESSTCPCRSVSVRVRPCGEKPQHLSNYKIITEVINGVGQEDYVSETQKMLEYAPQLITDQELLAVKEKITDKGVKTALSKIYRQVALNPSGSFMSSFVRSDPLGVKTPLLKDFQNLNTALGYRIDVINGHFISKNVKSLAKNPRRGGSPCPPVADLKSKIKDTRRGGSLCPPAAEVDSRQHALQSEIGREKHLLMILSSPIKISDIKGSERLIKYLNSKLKGLPKGIAATIICGHLHSISNQEIMKKDIMVIMSIASILFLLLFIFWFRSIRAILLFILPFLGIIISAGICSLFIQDFALFVIGMGGVLAGIAVDYGIHSYVAVRVGGNSVEHMRKIFRPIMVGALTTIGVLASFFLSKVEGYHQLAAFSVISLGVCVLCALFVLPHFFNVAQASCLRAKPTQPPRFRRSGAVGLLALWGIFIILAVFFAVRLKFNDDIVQFDGSRPEIFKAEQQFHKIWGNEDQTAILVAQGKTLDEALKLNEQLYADSAGKVLQLSSIAPLWPSESIRKQNSRNWVKFWKGGEESKLKSLIEKYSPEYGFSKDAFAPFFDTLYKNIDAKNEQPPFMQNIMKRFIIKTEKGYKVLSFFPDTKNNIEVMNGVCSNIPGVFVVSRNSISRLLSESLFNEILFMILIAAIVIPLLTIIFLRNIILTLIALIPVFSGILGILGIFGLLRMQINAPSIISSIVVLGLCIDYGIFMVYFVQTKRKTGTKVAVILSALTTLMGAGGLLFAKHPVLYYVGFTVSIGILFGAISAILVVPAFYRMVKPRMNPAVALRAMAGRRK